MLGTDAQKQSLIDLFHEGTKLAYKKGEFIIRDGETPTGVFYIEKGLVKAYDISKYGEENLLIIRKEHEIFPLIWAITGVGRHVMYEALSPVIVWRLDPVKYIERIKTQSDLLPPVMDIVLEMYRIHSERIINLEYRSVRERLVSFLLIMVDRFGKKTKEGWLINAPLRHQDIASSISATRETTGRELSALEKKGLLHSQQSMITLLDVEKLKSHL